MTARRVLVVEDDPQFRASLMGLIEDWGFAVFGAGSREEARLCVEQTRVHVVLLDVRLVEMDVDNREGMELLRELRAFDPTLEFIVITAHPTVELTLEALQPDATGRPPAFDFLVKDPDKLRAIPQKVQAAFANRVLINERLDIAYPPQFYEGLAKKLRLKKSQPGVTDEFAEESEELLRKLFADCQRIEISEVKSGFSRAAVLAVKPHYAHGEGEIRFVKLGEHDFVYDEVERYRSYVRGIVKGFRIPQEVTFQRTRSLGGVVYTFAGLGSSVDYAMKYEQGSRDLIFALNQDLFMNTCANLHGARPENRTNADLRTLYFQLLRLRDASLIAGLENILTGKDHPFRRYDDEHVEYDGAIRLIDPVRFALNLPMIVDYPEVTVHGDLHCHNVLIDRHDETWLIDFSQTGRGPEIHDYITFETFLRVNMLKDIGLRQRYLWERALMDESPLPSELEQEPSLVKMHEVVCHIRGLALRKNDIITRRLYYYGLLMTALRLLTVMFLHPTQRDHALIAAALAAEKLTTP